MLMADFCKACSMENFGFDARDLAGLCQKGFAAQVICEGCGEILVDHTGKCCSCELMFGKPGHGDRPIVLMKGVRLWPRWDFQVEVGTPIGETGLACVCSRGGILLPRYCPFHTRYAGFWKFEAPSIERHRQEIIDLFLSGQSVNHIVFLLNYKFRIDEVSEVLRTALREALDYLRY